MKAGRGSGGGGGRFGGGGGFLKRVELKRSASDCCFCLISFEMDL